jgi:hypothetical protein
MKSNLSKKTSTDNIANPTEVLNFHRFKTHPITANNQANRSSKKYQDLP